MKKKVLVYPCGTEIAFEIYNSVKYSTHFELYGGSSGYDHGHFVYKNLVTNLPFITDSSSREDIREFNRIIKEYGFDIIYPAMDGVLTVFARYRDELEPLVAAPETETAEIVRVKSKTYSRLKRVVPVPRLYEKEELPENYPVFVKPDIGQGSAGANRIDTKEEYIRLRESGRLDGCLVMEYLGGREYTVDCFTNLEGELIFARARIRNRIKSGISVNAEFIDAEADRKFTEYAKRINEKLGQRGGWFFQMREADCGELKLLEVAGRIAGASAITRNIGVNLPLLTLFTHMGIDIEEVLINDYEIELDRALCNSYRIELEYDSVYVDFDDTLVCDGGVNLSLVAFLYQCLNESKKIFLITRHKGELMPLLEEYRIKALFDEIFHLKAGEKKSECIDSKLNPIFIDDSYGERKEVKERLNIPVFDVAMTECLMHH